MMEEMARIKDEYKRRGDDDRWLHQAVEDVSRVLRDAPPSLMENVRLAPNDSRPRQGAEVAFPFSFDGDAQPPKQDCQLFFRFRRFPRIVNEHIDATGRQWNARRMYHFMVGVQVLIDSGAGTETTPLRLCEGCAPLKFGVLRCGRCRDAYYCSAECQRADWRWHREACVPPPSADAEAVD